MSLTQARLLVNVQRWGDAKAMIVPVLADPDAGAEPWFLLAQCDLALADFGAARNNAARGLALAPDSEWGHRLMSSAQLRSGDKRAAQRSADRALALSPNQPQALFSSIRVLLARGRKREAEQLAKRNLANNPHNALAWESAASVALGRRRWSEAEQRARSGLRIDPQDTDLMMQLGMALQRQGRRAEAAELYATASRTNPADQRGRRALGRIGMTVVGSGGAFGLKFVIASVLINNNRSWLFSNGGRHVRWVTLAVAAALALAYGIQELRQRRAVAQISPQLRAVANRERRAVSRSWLRLIGFVAGLLAVLALTARDFTTAAALIGVSVSAGCLWSRWAPPDANRGWLGLLPQSIRWRFR